MYRKARSVAVTVAVAGMLSLSTVGRGDDTDIYSGNNPNTSVDPLVMFTLDMKANALSASFCSYDGSGTDDCFNKVGDEIYPFLVAANTIYSLDYATKGVNLFDAFRALHATLYAELEGVAVGFMVPHNEQTADGGYLLRRFRVFEANDANGAKAELLEKLYSIPDSGAGSGGGGGGSRARLVFGV